MDRIRIGIVGLGHNGIAHLRAHLELGKSEVVALCDRNEDRLRAAGAEFGVDVLYTDDGFYAHPGMDAVGIHTGDSDHLHPFLSAVAAGKHVLIEKPLANTEHDVVAMVSAADAADPGLKIQVGYILRFNPVFQAIHQSAIEGDLGDIYYMEGDYIHNLLYQAAATDSVTGRNWYLEEELPMVGGGSHPLDLLRWFSGKEIVRTWCYATHAAFPEMRNDDCQVALFGFEDGSIAKVASLYAPRCAMAPFYNLRLYGTNGTVDRDQIAVSRNAEDVHPEFTPVEADRVVGHDFRDEIEDWLDAIVQDRPTRTGLHDGANSSIAALCAVRAAREGREVEVPVFRPKGFNDELT